MPELRTDGPVAPERIDIGDGDAALQMARDVLARKGDDTKTVVVDPGARYYGAALGTRSLVTPD